MGVVYVPVARVGELAPGQMKPADLGGRPVLVANVDGQHYVFVRQCPHEGADLADGELDGHKIRCENHSYCYDLKTGECVVPRGGPQLTVLPVEQRGEEVCVRLEW